MNKRQQRYRRAVTPIGRLGRIEHYIGEMLNRRLIFPNKLVDKRQRVVVAFQLPERAFIFASRFSTASFG
jgi:hypothetical protein